jgi:hypothetical protein
MNKPLVRVTMFALLVGGVFAMMADEAEARHRRCGGPVRNLVSIG